MPRLNGPQLPGDDAPVAAEMPYGTELSADFFGAEDARARRPPESAAGSNTVPSRAQPGREYAF